MSKYYPWSPIQQPLKQPLTQPFKVSSVDGTVFEIDPNKYYYSIHALIMREGKLDVVGPDQVGLSNLQTDVIRNILATQAIKPIINYYDTLTPDFNAMRAADNSVAAVFLRGFLPEKTTAACYAYGDAKKFTFLIRFRIVLEMKKGTEDQMQLYFMFLFHTNEKKELICNKMHKLCFAERPRGTNLVVRNNAECEHALNRVNPPCTYSFMRKICNSVFNTDRYSGLNLNLAMRSLTARYGNDAAGLLDYFRKHGMSSASFNEDNYYSVVEYMAQNNEIKGALEQEYQ